MQRKAWRGSRRQWLILVAFVPLAAIITAPQVLAFPHLAQVGAWTIRSEAPIPSGITTVIGRAEALLAASPINRPQPRSLFLTNGGWRWSVLALQSAGAFGLTRPINEAIIINRNNVAADLVFNNRAIGSRRTLSGTVAHEAAHGLLRQRYGVLGTLLMPNWQVEGYCDHVAQESALDDATARLLIAASEDHPALVYWQGRKRVAALLSKSVGNVDVVMQDDNQLR